MKLIRYCLLLLLTPIFCCSPKNEEASEEHIDTDLSGETIDSLSNSRRDIVTRPDTENLDPLPLPQPVLQLLEQHYRGWEKPALMSSAENGSGILNQSSFMVSGDFNGDNHQDYAIQIQKDKHVVIIAFLYSSGNWQVQELKKDILFNDRGTLKSLYQLELAEKGTTLQNQESNQEFTLQNDAVSVGIENNRTTYVLENSRFKGYITEN